MFLTSTPAIASLRTRVLRATTLVRHTNRNQSSLAGSLLSPSPLGQLFFYLAREEARFFRGALDALGRRCQQRVSPPPRFVACRRQAVKVNLQRRIG